MKREIKTHKIEDKDINQSLDIWAEDGKTHEYVITYPRKKPDDGKTRLDLLNLVEINFQNGAVKEHGVNGISNESLLAIVIDRLQGFQSGEFSCRENAIALTKLEEAMLWLHKRTKDRLERGVEGKNIK
jgi:hypothetical protein